MRLRERARERERGEGERGEGVTEILNGGMDGVAPVEEKTYKPRADEAAAAGDANSLISGHFVCISLFTQLRTLTLLFQ